MNYEEAVAEQRARVMESFLHLGFLRENMNKTKDIEKLRVIAKEMLSMIEVTLFTEDVVSLEEWAR